MIETTHSDRYTKVVIGNRILFVNHIKNPKYEFDKPCNEFKNTLKNMLSINNIIYQSNIIFGIPLSEFKTMSKTKGGQDGRSRDNKVYVPTIVRFGVNFGRVSHNNEG